MALPDFFIIGAPKAGTSALHRALAGHAELYLSPVKEPKYFLSGGVAPAVQGRGGPGDAHSAREWIWRRGHYEALFEAAPRGTLRGESTPFYLYDRRAQRRIAEAVPRAKLIAILRDPVDRAYSNWMHLWSDGLEPVADFMDACGMEELRIRAGWAPFWHYRRLGRYGEQLEHLRGLFPADQVSVFRYRQLVDAPRETLEAICGFLGVAPDPTLSLPAENIRPLARPCRRTSVLGAVMRAGAALGAHAPPQVWRKVSVPLLWALHRDGTARPELDVEARRRLLDSFVDDIALLERVTGDSFSDWLADRGGGEFSTRLDTTP
jgi:hypothetical protein